MMSINKLNRWRFIYVIAFVPFFLLVLYFLYTEYKQIKDFVFVIDDVWIHLQFAQNLANGLGFSFNPGYFISASTAPLYTLSLTVLFKLSSSYIFNVYLLSIASTIAIIYLSFKTTLLLTKNRLFSLMVAFFISINPWLTWNALSGMEISFGSFLLTSGFYLHIKNIDLEKKSNYLPLFLFSLATLVRPESYSILFLYFLLEGLKSLSLLSNKKKNKFYKSIENFLYKILLAIAIILPYGLFSIKTSGSFFPNTYTAKVGDLGIIGLLKNYQTPDFFLLSSFSLIKLYFLDFINALKNINLYGYYLLFPSIIILLVKAYQKKGLRLFFLPFIFLIFPLSVGLLVPSDRVSWPWNRHMLYLTPLYLQLILLPLWLLFSKNKKLLYLVLAIFILINIYDLKSNIFIIKKFFTDRTTAMKSEHITLSVWIKDNISEKATIAASDIGVIGFNTKNFIYDTEGLINPDIRYFKHRRNSLDKDKEVYSYLQKTKPDFLIKFIWVYPSFGNEEFPLLKQEGSFALYKTPWTRDSMIIKETF